MTFRSAPWTQEPVVEDATRNKNMSFIEKDGIENGNTSKAYPR